MRTPLAAALDHPHERGPFCSCPCRRPRERAYKGRRPFRENRRCRLYPPRWIPAADDFGTKVREVLGIGRLELAGWANLVGRVPGHDLVNGGGVVEQTVRCVAHRTDHSEFVIHLRQLRQKLCEVYSRDLCRDRLE